MRASRTELWGGNICDGVVSLRAIRLEDCVEEAT